MSTEYCSKLFHTSEHGALVDPAHGINRWLAVMANDGWRVQSVTAVPPCGEGDCYAPVLILVEREKP